MTAPIMSRRVDPCGQGYVTDVPYVHSFIASVAPAVLDHVALLQGFAPPSREDFTYCDLGCGQGLSAAILAATHPRGVFHGVDFMAAHIEHARRFCDEAAISNATFHHADFRAAAESGLPQFDYIVCHGVYAWVDAGVQRDLVHFIDTHLKLGGLAYISYNAMPGWATELPFQYLLRALAQTLTGDSKARITAAIEMIGSMPTDKMPGINHSFMAKQLDAATTKLPPLYLAHEFMNGHWRPLFVTEVREVMSTIGLSPVGFASLMSNFDSFVLGGEARQALASITDHNIRELVRDYYIDQRFRRDIYIRGGRRINTDEQRRRLLASCFSLLQPAEKVVFAQRTPAGTLRFENQTARAIVAILADGPRRLSDIALAPGLDEQDVLANALTLCAAGVLAPVENASASVAKLNRAISARVDGPERIDVLALPCGTALPIASSLRNALSAAENAKSDATDNPDLQGRNHQSEADLVAWRAFFEAQGVQLGPREINPAG